MAHSDPLGDMLIRIKNGQRAQHAVVTCPASKARVSLLEVLKTEGFIRAFSEIEGEDGHKALQIELKYDNGEPTIREISRISKPSRRIYRKADNLPRVSNGLGIAIISTAQGVMSDHEARAKKIGGEVWAQVY